MAYIAPKALLNKFTCPHCGAIALQRWEVRGYDFYEKDIIGSNPLRVAKCDHCEEHSI